MFRESQPFGPNQSGVNGLWGCVVTLSSTSLSFFLVSLSFRAASTAYVCSQVMGAIGAVAASLCHSHTSLTYTTAHGNARSLTH